MEASSRTQTRLPVALPGLDGSSTLLKVIGCGSYGSVYLSKTQNGRLRACKCTPLLSSPLGATPKKGQVVCRSSTAELEAQLMKFVKHDHIIKLYDSKVIGNRMWLSLEYAHYGNVYDYLKSQGRQQLIEEELAVVAQSVLRALQHCHKKQIIHRDLKPSNILITESGKVKLGDLGVACPIGELISPIKSDSVHSEKSQRESPSITHKNDINKTNNKSSSIDNDSDNLSFLQDVQGTLEYLAPEVFLTDKYDTSIDIWALGITMIELSQGFHPFIKTHTARLLYYLVEGGDSPSLASPDDFSPTLVHFIAQCLIIDPSKRPSAKQLLKHPFLKKCSSKFPIENKTKNIQSQLVSSPQMHLVDTRA